jgi:hypothetical protein
LIAGFLGTLVASVLALTWERERGRSELERNAHDLHERRKTEARRRLEPVRAELEKNAQSLRLIVEAFESKEHREALAASVVAEDSVRFLINPQLLEGAWAASASRLSELIADYRLIANLATTYGRIEELRWRVRYRTEHERTILDSPIRQLAVELRDEVEKLLERVRQQINEPDVQPLGLAHKVSISSAIEVSSALGLEVSRGEPAQKPDAQKP